MGICSSYEATEVAAATSTAKLVLPDGKLQEFDRPVKVSHVLQKDSKCFVCNADDMEFDGFVSAVAANEHLQLGQLYFLLPLSMLRKPLQAEEMAALAVKASTALMKAAACRCPRRSVAPLAFPTGSSADVPAPGGASAGRQAGSERRRRAKSGSGHNFASELGAIPE